MEMKANMQVKMEHNWFKGTKLMVVGMNELFIYVLIYLLYYLFAHLCFGGMRNSCN